jgi:hypothetical protein
MIVLLSVSTTFDGFKIFVATMLKDDEAAAKISGEISSTGNENTVGYCSSLDSSIVTDVS